LADAQIARGCPVRMRVLHNLLPLADTRFQEVNKAKWHGIDLCCGLDETWKRLDEATQRAIKKARKQGVTVEIRQDEAAVEAFFALHLDIRKYKYRMLAQPQSFFRSIYKHLIAANAGAILTATFEGKVIAATLVLHWQDTLTYKFNASSRDMLSVRPNDLLIWNLIEYAVSLGCSQVDFGLSDWDQDGLIRFKGKYATKEETIHFLTYMPQGYQDQAASQQLRGLLGALTDLFTRPEMPDDLTRQAGDLIYRYFV